MAEVTRLPQIGTRLFGWKATNSTAVHEFLVAREIVQPRRRGKALESLPIPWDQVFVFLNKDITCEGRYRIVYISDFILLSHLHHNRLLNMPFYLLRYLQSMAQYVKSSQNTVSSLTNHGLIKLLVLRALAHQNLTWEQFVSRPRVDRKPVLEIEGIGEESDE